MARWFALGVDLRPYGPMFDAPSKTDAIDAATMRDGLKCFGAVSVPEWEEIQAKRDTEARLRARELE